MKFSEIMFQAAWKFCKNLKRCIQIFTKFFMLHGSSVSIFHAGSMNFLCFIKNIHAVHVKILHVFHASSPREAVIHKINNTGHKALLI